MIIELIAQDLLQHHWWGNSGVSCGFLPKERWWRRNDYDGYRKMNEIALVIEETDTSMRPG